MTDIKLPPLSNQLIKALEKAFPMRMPELKMSDREIWMEVGIQKVIAYLKEQKNRQEELF